MTEVKAQSPDEDGVQLNLAIRLFHERDDKSQHEFLGVAIVGVASRAVQRAN